MSVVHAQTIAPTAPQKPTKPMIDAAERHFHDGVRFTEEGNYEAAKIYNLCQGQYRTAGPDNMPIAGDVTAIISVMEVCRVRDKQRGLEKVLAAFNHFISKGAENARS